MKIILDAHLDTQGAFHFTNTDQLGTLWQNSPRQRIPVSKMAKVDYAYHEDAAANTMDLHLELTGNRNLPRVTELFLHSMMEHFEPGPELPSPDMADMVRTNVLWSLTEPVRGLYPKQGGKLGLMHEAGLPYQCEVSAVFPKGVEGQDVKVYAETGIPFYVQGADKSYAFLAHDLKIAALVLWLFDDITIGCANKDDSMVVPAFESEADMEAWFKEQFGQDVRTALETERFPITGALESITVEMGYEVTEPKLRRHAAALHRLLDSEVLDRYASILKQKNKAKRNR